MTEKVAFRQVLIRVAVNQINFLYHTNSAIVQKARLGLLQMSAT